MSRPYTQSAEQSSAKAFPVIGRPLARRKLCREHGLSKPHARLIAELQGYGSQRHG